MSEEIINDNPEEYEDIPFKGMRKIIAANLVRSKAPVPHFYLVSEINMENIIKLRNQLNESQTEVKITFNDMFIKLTGMTLKEYPSVTSHLIEDKIRKYKNIHIGFAVAIEDGLLVPVIKNCDKKTIAEIAIESKELLEKAKSKKLRRHEMTSAVFTISNLGMYDIDHFSAIINPPESAILAVGSIIKKPVVINDKIEIRNRMKVTLSCDHRIVDGATGAEFLKTLKFNFENTNGI